jgi:hypothetical protein
VTQKPSSSFFSFFLNGYKIMKTLLQISLAFILALSVQEAGASEVKPGKHLEVPSVTTIEDAKIIFLEKTLEMNSKQTLNETELQQIHIITYSLEKSLIYFNENLTGEKKMLVKKIADTVESIHLNSENNRKEETQKQLNKYFGLASKFIYQYWHI